MNVESEFLIQPDEVIYTGYFSAPDIEAEASPEQVETARQILSSLFGNNPRMEFAYKGQRDNPGLRLFDLIAFYTSLGAALTPDVIRHITKPYLEEPLDPLTTQAFSGNIKATERLMHSRQIEGFNRLTLIGLAHLSSAIRTGIIDKDGLNMPLFPEANGEYTLPRQGLRMPGHEGARAISRYYTGVRRLGEAVSEFNRSNPRV